MAGEIASPIPSRNILFQWVLTKWEIRLFQIRLLARCLKVVFKPFDSTAVCFLFLHFIKVFGYQHHSSLIPTLLFHIFYSSTPWISALHSDWFLQKAIINTFSSHLQIETISGKWPVAGFPPSSPPLIARRKLSPDRSSANNDNNNKKNIKNKTVTSSPKAPSKLLSPFCFIFHCHWPGIDRDLLDWKTLHCKLITN